MPSIMKGMIILMSKNKILKVLQESVIPLSVSELSQKLSCSEAELLDYIDNLEKSNLIIRTYNPKSCTCDYSRQRITAYYRCSSVVPEYLRKELCNHVLTISSIIAAITSVAALLIA